jgi:hypothetical protein
MHHYSDLNDSRSAPQPHLAVWAPAVLGPLIHFAGAGKVVHAGEDERLRLEVWGSPSAGACPVSRRGGYHDAISA